MPEDLKQLKRFIINKSKKLAEEMICQHPDWFTQEQNTLIKLIKDHNTTIKTSLSNQTNKSRDKPQTTRAKLQTTKRKAKKKLAMTIH